MRFYEKYPEKKVVKKILKKHLPYNVIDIMMNSESDSLHHMIWNYILWCRSDMRKQCNCIIDDEGCKMFEVAIMAALTRLKIERNHQIYHTIDEKRNIIVSFILKTTKSFLSK